MIDLRFFQAAATLIPVLFIALAFQTGTFRPIALKVLDLTQALRQEVRDTTATAGYAARVERGEIPAERAAVHRAFAAGELVPDRDIWRLTVTEAWALVGVALFLGSGEGTALYALATGHGHPWEAGLVGGSIGLAALVLGVQALWPALRVILQIGRPR